MQLDCSRFLPPRHDGKEGSRLANSPPRARAEIPHISNQGYPRYRASVSPYNQQKEEEYSRQNIDHVFFLPIFSIMEDNAMLTGIASTIPMPPIRNLLISKGICRRTIVSKLTSFFIFMIISGISPQI